MISSGMMLIPVTVISESRDGTMIPNEMRLCTEASEEPRSTRRWRGASSATANPQNSKNIYLWLKKFENPGPSSQ